MVSIAHFERLFAYDGWANAEEVSRLLRIDRPAAKAIELLAHIAGTEWLWLARLRGEKPKLDVWPTLTFDGTGEEFDLLRREWKDYLAAAPLDEEIHYVNTKGEPWTSRIDDVLTHVILHGSYHRGQIAIVLRQSGEEPPYTDFIHCTRQRFID